MKLSKATLALPLLVALAAGCSTMGTGIGPLWGGWHPGWNRFGGWDGWNATPSPDFIQHYSGRATAMAGFFAVAGLVLAFG